MATIYEILAAGNLRGFYEDATEGQVAPLGQLLFPRRKKLGLEIKFIKGRGGIPVVLKPSAFDTAVTIRDRIGLSEVKTEMPFFKESMVLREVDRQDLLKMMETGNDAYVDNLVAEIFNDERTLIDGAVSQEERLRMQLLTQGKIAVAANGVNLEYDYGMPTANNLTATKVWTDATADIGKEVLGWKLAAAGRGVTVTRALTNSTTIVNLLGNTAIGRALGADKGNLVTPNLISQWFAANLGLQLIVYDAVFVDEAGATTKYVPDGVFTMLPEGALGETVFGTTPEEADLMSGATDAEVALVNTGMAITTIKTKDPVNVQTKVSMITLPSFEQADKVLIAKVNG